MCIHVCTYLISAYIVCKCICICICMLYMYMYLHMNMYMYMFLHLYMYIYMYMYMYMYMIICICVCEWKWIWMWLWIWLWIWIWNDMLLYVSMFMRTSCIYIFVDIHTQTPHRAVRHLTRSLAMKENRTSRRSVSA